MQKVLKPAGKIIQTAITLLLALLFICNLYLIFSERVFGVESPTIGGYSTAVIASGSMEPALSVDDLILNHRQKEYEEGDVITFQSGDSLTTHRIVAVTDEGYITKGDANNTEDDQVVKPDAVIGRVTGSIPGIGRILWFLKTPLGMLLLVLAGFLIIELPFLMHQREGKNRQEEL